MNLSTTTLEIAGHPVSITGSDADPYFRSIEAFAAELAPLHRFVAEHVAAGVILDVGANIGLTSLAMSFAAPGSTIVAFEPSPTNIPLFEANTRGRPGIRLVQSGVGDRPGQLDFVVPPAGANCHVATSEYEFASSPDFRPAQVPITTLDSYVDDNLGDQRVALIKIDVEGFEPNVLAGARSLIRRWRPVIWMEFNSVTLNVAQGYSPMAFARALFDCFDVLRVGKDGALHEVRHAGALVHDNITLHGSIEDIVLRPRPDVAIPDVEAMTIPRSVRAELERLRKG
jgi:FkbM family methyltransferase